MGIGPMELVVVGIIALLLFGKRLPEVARSVGKSFHEFKRGLNDVTDVSSYPAESDSHRSPASPRPLPREEEPATGAC